MRHLFLAAAIAALLALPAQAEGDAAAGEKVFALCKACHRFDRNGHGPSLKGVVGRKAGVGAEGYAFSDALTRAGLTWDEATLKEWLKDSRKMVPGSKMFFIGIKDEKRLDDLIAYLKSKP